MKKYFILLIVLLCVACKKQLRDNQIVDFHNFSAPEKNSFQLDNQTFLNDGFFNADVLDSSKMQRLDQEAATKLLLINDNLYGRDIFENDSVFSVRCENTYFYIYGKLDLQPNVNSFVLWLFIRDIYHRMYHFKSMELLNIKDNKLCSFVTLDVRPTEMLTRNVFSRTYLKNKCFTAEYEWKSPHSFWENLSSWLNSEDYFDKYYYAHYQINEDGFVEFVDKKYCKNKSNIPVLPIVERYEE